MSEFLSEIFQFLVVKFSIYLNRCVFVMLDTIEYIVLYRMCCWLIWIFTVFIPRHLFSLYSKYTVGTYRDDRHGTIQAKETLKSHEICHFVSFNGGDNHGFLHLL